MISKTLFGSFLKQLKTHKPLPQYYSDRNIIQSSIGLIFKIKNCSSFSHLDDIVKICSKEKCQISLLFTQRSGHQLDSNKYNVVFPGGQADKEEDDLTACKRQLYEQIRLKVDNQCIYIGSLPKNFYYAKKRNKSLMITCHIWVMKQEQQKFQPTLNKDQLISHRWVPIQQLVDPQNLREYQQKQMILLKRMGLRYPKISNYLQQNIKVMKMSGLSIGLDRDLWGLTLWVWSYFLMITRAGLQSKKPRQPQMQQLNKRISIMIEQIKKIGIQFTPNFLLGVPIRKIALYWYKKNRIQQFSYPQINKNYYYIYGFLTVLFMIILLGSI